MFIRNNKNDRFDRKINLKKKFTNKKYNITFLKNICKGLHRQAP